MEEPAVPAGTTPAESTLAPAGRYTRTGRPREILVDPAVSRSKFERELKDYRRIERDQRRHGWWLLEAVYPEVLVAFVGANLRPPAILFAALLDFTNYDLWAPSVTLVNPFTTEPLKMREIPHQLRMVRKIQQQVEVPGVGTMTQEGEQPLLQAELPDEVPFFCIPGVREYHEHPGHSADDWLDHRGKGEGTLFFLLEKLYQYGAAPIKGYQIGMHISGFVRPDNPL